MNLTLGQKPRRSITLTSKQVATYAEITGDHNPLHFDLGFAKRTEKLDGLIVQGGLTTGLLHALVATDLPGPGTVFLSQNWRFPAPVYIGDTITAEVEVVMVHETKPVCRLRVAVTRQTGEDGPGRGGLVLPVRSSCIVKGLVCALLLAAPLAAQAPRLGTIDFPTSGAPPAHREFVTGVLYLHSFEYERAAQAFRRADQLDPGFAMAYWGEALTYTHPVWDEQDVGAGRDALARLAPTRAARRARAPTGREQAYLDAVEILYGTGSKGERDTAYAAAMAGLVAAYPSDLEAKAFHALSLLGLSRGVRDVPTYLRAAAIADTVFRANPNHPGAAHYIIHAYDDPAHARLGLAAARAYSKIAPDAAHAQHMTTHIFVALGLWDDVVAQNEIAQQLTYTAPGHYTAWLNYGYLQQGRHRDARAHLGTLRGNMSANPPRRQRAGLALIRAHFLVNTRQWDGDVARWSISLGDTTAGANVLDAFVGGLGAFERGDRVAARQALTTLDALTGRAAASSADGDEDPEVGEIQSLELRALLQVAAAPDSAVALLRRAAALEDAMPVAFGPPAVIKPTHELLGEVLLSLRRPREAQTEFQRALALAPRRALSLLGLRRAAAAAGDSTAARDAARELRDVWHRADRLPELAELDQGYP